MVFFDDFGQYITNNKKGIKDILFEDIGGPTKGDAFLVQRSNHEGEQPISTITNLQTKLDSKVDRVKGRDLSDENFTKAKKQKLEHIQNEATKNQSDEYLVERSNHTGEQPIESIINLQSVLDTKVDRVEGRDLSDENFSKDYKQKLEQIQNEATKNQSNEYLLARSNHTGMQSLSTISNLQTMLDIKVNKSTFENYKNENNTTIENFKNEINTTIENSTSNLSNLGNPIGTIITFVSVTKIPSMYLMCDGSEYDTTEYSELFDLLQQNTTPDLRDRFIRSVGNLESDPLKFQDYATARPQTSDFTTNVTGNHDHIIPGAYGGGLDRKLYGIQYISSARMPDGGKSETTINGNHSHTITGGGDSETRPMNMTVVFLIKAK